jgi:hypothetical protein
MLDRLIAAATNLTVVGVIAAAGVTSLVLGYWGLVQVCNGMPTGAAAMAAALLPAALACKGAVYRNDLVDR